MADDFIVLFLGEGFTKSIPVLKILSVLFVVLGMARVIGTPLLIPLKRENKYTVAVCSGAVINVVLNSIMIPRYQAVGASIATICAESMVTFLEIFFIRDLFESKVIFKSIIHYCIPSMLMAGVITLVRYLISDTVLRLVVSVIAGGSIYVIVLLVIKDELIKDNLLNPIFKKLHIPLSL